MARGSNNRSNNSRNSIYRNIQTIRLLRMCVFRTLEWNGRISRGRERERHR